MYNHLRKWRQRWVKVCRLKDLSGATWDENTYSIILDDEHLMGHTKDHPKDVEFLNTPIDNYVQMQIIFGAGQATGRFTMGSTEPLGNPSEFSQSNLASNEFTTSGAGSMGGLADASFATAPMGSAAGPSSSTTYGAGIAGSKTAEDNRHLGKRRRPLTDDEALIMTGLTGAVQMVAEGLKAPVVVQKVEVPPNLYSLCMSTPGFTDEDLMLALNHLMDNKR